MGSGNGLQFLPTPNFPLPTSKGGRNDHRLTTLCPKARGQRPDPGLAALQKVTAGGTGRLGADRAVPAGPGRYTTANITTKQQLIQAILNERRIEFLGEGIRWLDIHRLAQDATFGTKGIPAKASRVLTFTNLYTNNPATTFTMQAAIPYSDGKFIWPIPIEEINNNPTLKTQQNPGY